MVWPHPRYWDTLRSGMVVASAVGLALVPLNKSRAYTASAIMRAALELGNPESSIPGPPGQRHLSRLGRCGAYTLNPTGQSRVTRIAAASAI